MLFDRAIVSCVRADASRLCRTGRAGLRPGRAARAGHPCHLRGPRARRAGRAGLRPGRRIRRRKFYSNSPNTADNGIVDADVIYYSNFHAARRKSCECGSNQRVVFEGKIGPNETIEHVWDQLNGSLYGVPVRFYKRIQEN